MPYNLTAKKGTNVYTNRTQKRRKSLGTEVVKKSIQKMGLEISLGFSIEFRQISRKGYTTEGLWTQTIAEKRFGGKNSVMGFRTLNVPIFQKEISNITGQVNRSLEKWLKNCIVNSGLMSLKVFCGSSFGSTWQSR